LLTGAAVFSVLWPLAKTPRSVGAKELDVSFYKAQIAEIEKELERGAIGPEEGESAKTEAVRRLLAAVSDNSEKQKGDSRFAVRLAACGALLFVPAFALGLYSVLGHPDLPDQPLAARLETPVENLDLKSAIARIETHLAAHPDDGRGYEVLAPAYLKIGRIDDAVRAYESALRLLGESAQRRARYGEALVVSANGIVTEAARLTFEKALSIDPALPMARFYLGIAAEQEGDKARALDIWNKLLADSPRDAAWAPGLRARIAALSEKAPERPGQDAAGIAALSGEERAAIDGMVERLASRLAQSGADIEGWLRLVRAYKILNQTDKARSALDDARRNLQSDAGALTRLDALARELGLEG
jgi:cytochrome c-type biogenesis protein CcmH